MKILITGAFGNLGLMCVDEALAMGFSVRCFDIDTPLTRKKSENYSGKVEIIFGNILNETDLRKIVDGVDGIIHNASLLPPYTETKAELARKINVEATRKLISISENANPKIRFVFPSSVTVFGRSVIGESARETHDPVEATDNYTCHKLEIESVLKASALNWCILRVGVSVDTRTTSTDLATLKQLLDVKAGNPLEWVHPKDVAYAMCQVMRSSEALRKILLIGGGTACQVTQRDFLQAAISAFGLSLPQRAHGNNDYYTHWMNTAESQRILGFQHHTFQDYKQQMSDHFKWTRRLLLPFSPLINLLLQLLFLFMRK